MYYCKVKLFVSSTSRRAFTLIELLVVIAIIAVLAVVVVLTLNPGQLILQARDSSRLSDLANIQTAINLYVTDAAINGSMSLGSTSVTYVSVPDLTATTTAGTDCTGLGFPSGGSFHCAASSTYRKTDGTGWIPVKLSQMSTGASLGQLPIDPVNNASTSLYWTYATNGTTWKIGAVPESQKYAVQANSFSAGNNSNLLGGFPTQGWVTVPGNSTFGTQTFSVMKYPAVCSDGNGTYLNDYDTSYHTYANNSKPCIVTNSRQIASLPGGWPIANIAQSGDGSHNDAVSYCANIGAHLMTNAEWQTIAWNAENVGTNWNGGTVGTSYMYSGHNDNVPATASPASQDDTQGYSGTDGPSSGGGTGSNATQRRTLTLSNGQVIWDIGGNIWQWTNDTIMGAVKPVGSGGTGAWSEWTTVSYAGSTLTAQTAGPSNIAWNSGQGMGQYYEGGNTGGPYGFLRGGSWTDGSNAGAGTLRLAGGPSAVDGGIGFRCSR